MQYREMNKDELQSYYNRYKHRYYVDSESGGICVRDCRSDRGALGRSNLLFHLPMAGILVNNKGQDYDVVTEMFPLHSSAQLVWDGFNRNACILLGTGVLGDAKKSFKSHFEVTFDSKKAQYIYIRDLNRAPDELLRQAIHYHLGNRNSHEIIDQYNHYVFPLGLTYRKPGAQCIIEHNTLSVKSIRDNYRCYLEHNFGPLPLIKRHSVGSIAGKDFISSHYEDDLSCQCSFVIDACGRLLEPIYEPDKPHFIGVTTATTETWKAVAADVAIITYRSTCFSLPAEYIFEQRPIPITVPQRDRITMLANRLQNQRYEKAKTAHLLDFMDKSSDTTAWR